MNEILRTCPKGVSVLSLFDGISCARVALDRSGIPVKTYYAAEIEKNAIKVSQHNYSDIVRLGDVREIQTIDEPIDLLIGGSPCQDLSIAKKDRKGLEGNRSSLFYEYVRIRNLVRPKWFVLENVASMPKKDRDIITKELGVEPVLFNASLVSAQCRKRLFWTNIQFDLPADRGIKLKDVLQIDDHATGAAVRGNTQTRTPDGIVYSDKLDIRTDEKANALTPTFANKLALVKIGPDIRKLTPIECERLQGLPDDYTKMVSSSSRYRCLGNAFNVDVIAHILTAMRNTTGEN